MSNGSQAALAALIMRPCTSDAYCAAPYSADAPFISERPRLRSIASRCQCRGNSDHEIETCSSGTRVRRRAFERAGIRASPWTRPLPRFLQFVRVLFVFVCTRRRASERLRRIWRRRCIGRRGSWWRPV